MLLRLSMAVWHRYVCGLCLSCVRRTMTSFQTCQVQALECGVSSVRCNSNQRYSRDGHLL